MITLDLALVTAIIGIASAVVSAFLTVNRYTSSLKLQIQELRHTDQLQNLRLDSALQLLDKRLRDLEKHSEANSGFVPHHRRNEVTGAPWLKD